MLPSGVSTLSVWLLWYVAYSSTGAVIRKRLCLGLQGTYALWIAFSPYIRHGLLNNYLLCVLPMLFGVTIFSTSPLIFTSFLSIISFAFIAKSQKRSNFPRSPEKPKGQWLDESDSDEEPAEPASAAGSAAVSPVKLLPSQVAFASGSLLSPDPTASPMSPSSSSGSGHEDPLGIMGVNRRRSPLEGVSLDVPSHFVNKIRVSPAPSLRLKKPRATKAQGVEEKGRLPFLTVYRAHMMLMTVICILAVDFDVFPRWQGKCEDFGTSLVSYSSVRKSLVLTSLPAIDGRGCRIICLFPRAHLHKISFSSTSTPYPFLARAQLSSHPPYPFPVNFHPHVPPKVHPHPGPRVYTFNYGQGL